MGTVKEVAAVEVRELVKGITAELYKEVHSSPSQSVNLEWMNSLSDWKAKE